MTKSKSVTERPPRNETMRGPISPALSTGAQATRGAGSMYGQLSHSAKELKLPERLGEPDCQYYLKTGNCKFGVSCKYNHPSDRGASAAAGVLGPLGLPLRPGALPCPFYMQNGYCKFGPTCKFDHPMEMMMSLSATTPVAPYLAGSSVPILPPSSLSTDIQIDTQTTPALLSDSRSVDGDDEVRHSS